MMLAQKLKQMLPIAMLALAVCLPAQARLVKSDVDYSHDGKPMQGFLVYDDSLVRPGATPGILVYHAWMGIGAHEREWAEKLAMQGYVAFAPDIYGKGVRPTDPAKAGAEAGKYRGDRPLMRARAQAGLQQLLANQFVDKNQVGAIGFCFGGGVALELARSGAAIRGTVSLHGNLDTPNPADARNIKGKVLVLHGADDPYVKADQVAAFTQEMRDAGVTWQLNAYGGAVHAFSDPYAGDDPKAGAAYHPEAARRSWQDLQVFFKDLLGR